MPPMSTLMALNPMYDLMKNSINLKLQFQLQAPRQPLQVDLLRQAGWQQEAGPVRARRHPRGLAGGG